MVGGEEASGHKASVKAWEEEGWEKESDRDKGTEGERHRHTELNNYVVFTLKKGQME